MKKNLCIILGVLLSLGMFSACNNSDESTEVMAGNEDFFNLEDAEVEYVDLESLPGWLISWISSIEEKSGLFYFIYSHYNSCYFCDSYYEDGEQLDFHDEDFKQAFLEATQRMKRIYIK